MGSNAAIDVAIALILMYLVFSIIVTIVNEVIATAADLRASNLSEALTALLDDPTLRTDFYDHGLISGINSATADSQSLAFRFIGWLYRLLTGNAPSTAESHISYVSGQMFARAVLGSVDVTKTLPTFDDNKNAIEQMPDTNIRDVLLAQLATANGDLQLLHENVAAWFDNAMDRVSGVYKRHLKQISFFVGLVLVLATNGDTLKVARALWGDASLRAAMTQTASDFLANSQQAGASSQSSDVQPPQPENTTTSPTANDSSKVGLDDKLRKAIGQIGDAEQQLRPLPLGWSRSSIPKAFAWSLLFIVIAKGVGLGLTAIAISLGAPFWFDLLSMFMRVRGTGEKPQKTSST